MSQQWFYARGDQKTGPITSKQLRELVAAGSLMLGSAPCAVVVERSRVEFGGTNVDAKITTWYVKGKSAYRFEHKTITPSGEEVVTTRGELIYPK